MQVVDASEASLDKLSQNNKVFNSMLMVVALKNWCVMSTVFVPELPRFLSAGPEELLENFVLVGGVSGSFLLHIRATGLLEPVTVGPGDTETRNM